MKNELYVEVGRFTKKEISMKGLREGRDYEVISQTVIDSEGVEYASISKCGIKKHEGRESFYVYDLTTKKIMNTNLTLQEAFEFSQKAEEEYMEFLESRGVEIIPDRMNSDYAVQINGEVDYICAKKCMFGVIKMLKGEHKGEKFMFPILPEVIEEEHIMAYEAITYGCIEEKYTDILEDDFLLMAVLSRPLYMMVVGSLGI